MAVQPESNEHIDDGVLPANAIVSGDIVFADGIQSEEDLPSFVMPVHREPFSSLVLVEFQEAPEGRYAYQTAEVGFETLDGVPVVHKIIAAPSGGLLNTDQIAGTGEGFAVSFAEQTELMEQARQRAINNQILTAYSPAILKHLGLSVDRNFKDILKVLEQDKAKHARFKDMGAKAIRHHYDKSVTIEDAYKLSPTTRHQLDEDIERINDDFDRLTDARPAVWGYYHDILGRFDDTGLQRSEDARREAMRVWNSTVQAAGGQYETMRELVEYVLRQAGTGSDAEIVSTIETAVELMVKGDGDEEVLVEGQAKVIVSPKLIMDAFAALLASLPASRTLQTETYLNSPEYERVTKVVESVVASSTDDAAHLSTRGIPVVSGWDVRGVAQALKLANTVSYAPGSYDKVAIVEALAENSDEQSRDEILEEWAYTEADWAVDVMARVQRNSIFILSAKAAQIVYERLEPTAAEIREEIKRRESANGSNGNGNGGVLKRFTGLFATVPAAK